MLTALKCSSCFYNNVYLGVWFMLNCCLRKIETIFKFYKKFGIFKKKNDLTINFRENFRDCDPRISRISQECSPGMGGDVGMVYVETIFKVYKKNGNFW